MTTINKLALLFFFSVLVFQGCEYKGVNCLETPSDLLCDTTRINTAGWVDSPYITPDGKQLFFMYNRSNFFPIFSGGLPHRAGPDRPGHIPNNINPFDDSNLYVATRQADGSWSEPIAHAINQRGTSCCAMPTADGKRIYYPRGAKDKGSTHTDIFVIEEKSGKWLNPVNLGKAVNSDWIEDNPHISKDEQTLYWTSARPDGYGKKDLWFSTRQSNGAWTEARNMGPLFNTKESEDQFWVSGDGKEAYFNRETTIMRTELVRGKWQKPTAVNFGRPLHVGEASLTEDGKLMYLAVSDPASQIIYLAFSERQKNGTWSLPQPVD